MRICTKCEVAYEEIGFYGKHPHCKNCQSKAHKKYYREVLSKDLVRRRAYGTKYRNNNRERYRAVQNKYYARIRLEALSHYSKGQAKCACCGEIEIQFLSFDHINGGGLAHQRKIKIPLLRWLRINNYPEGFQVLCHNCNFAKGHYGQCPHNLIKGAI